MEKTLTNLLLKNFSEYSKEKNIFFTKENNNYVSFTNKQMLSQITKLIEFFKSINIKENDKVAIISESRVEWVVTDFACMFLKLISIPIYTSLSNQQISYILQNSESKICFVSNSFLLDKVLMVKNELPELKEIIVFTKIDSAKYDKNIIQFSDTIKYGNIHSEQESIELLKSLNSNIKSSDLLTIIYTSGTTGIPKGVMLTHNNIYSNVVACQKVLPINANDTFLSFLPYSHVYERTADYYLPLFCGAKIYYAKSIDTIAAQLSEVKPTFVITVPRLLDKMYNKLIKSAEVMTEGFRKKLFKWAMDVAQNKEISKNNSKWKLANKLVYKKIREKTGGKIRYFVSGGGALNKHVGEFFDRVGITILEGYGMTETSPVISVNPPKKNKYGTVGKPIDEVNVRIAEDGEILVKGDIVMKGYYKDEKTTNETIINGWLHTGDIGEIDKDGYLKITDRKKSFIKTSGGKYVAPSQIEDLISRLNYIEHIVVIGNDRMYITALIVPDKNELASFAKKNNINFESDEELLTHNLILKKIEEDINHLQKDLSNYERIRRFTLLGYSFYIESGELTPTMKVKRKFVEEKYKDIIEKMYLRI